MDKLRECAVVFNNLLNFQYNIVLGRKGVRRDICLTFNKIDFHHLVGLQYLTDRPQLNRDREKIFNKILNNEITYSHINGSDLFYVIENRILSFVYIEQLLDDNRLNF